MEKIIKTIFITGISVVALYVILLSLSPANSSANSFADLKLPKVAATAVDTYATKTVNIDAQPLQDNPNIYQYDDPGSVVTIFVTVRKGNPSDETNFTWSQLNDFTRYLLPNSFDAEIQKADAIVQFGNDTGPLPGEVGYGAVAPNATIELRGNTASAVAQESYKISLKNSAGKWRGMSTIDLNKHPNDDTRVRNKLSFDLLKLLPDTVSARTQFVHLYIRDQTTQSGDDAFMDYGLFTQVEQANTRFLRDHLLDRDAQLYKANDFEFKRYPDQIRLNSDPSYDESAFAPILEVKGNKNDAKLVQMLEDVNNYNIPIQPTFEKYFDANNYFTWLAFNILVGNLTTENQNFYLYSPHNGNKWYFLPWDYDQAFPLQNHADITQSTYAPWQNGVSNYWLSVLPNRLLREQEYRQALDEKVNAVKTILTPDRIKGFLDTYKKAVDPYVTRMPDLEYLGGSLPERDQQFELIPTDIQTNYDLYVESLKRPMPFFMGSTKTVNDELKFTWEAAYDFSGQDITYDFAVSTDWEFKDIVAQKSIKNLTEVQIDKLDPGTYFWRVTATNSLGNAQVPYNFYEDANSINHYGVRYLYVTPDGQLLEK